MIKVVFFDCDGTLLSHASKSVPISARKTIDLLKQKGIKVILATGRHYQELMMLPIADINFDGYILLNGQLCLDENKNILFSNPMVDKEQLKEIFNEKIVPLQILHKDEIYINFINSYVEDSLNDISTQYPTIKDFQDKDIYQAIAYVGPDKIEYLANKLPHSEITRWNDKAVDLMPIGGDKSKAVIRYCKEMNIKKEESMAFGDGINDISMMKAVGISIALKNCQPAVKQAATFVTDDIDDDGVYKAYLKYFQ